MEYFFPYASVYLMHTLGNTIESNGICYASECQGRVICYIQCIVLGPILHQPLQREKYWERRQEV